MASPPGPLLVYGPRSTDYDFGPAHPLTPRRFGPGIDLLRSVGAVPGLAPEPATAEELRMCHTQRYLDIVGRLSVDPDLFPEAGLGPGDTPAFIGMHAAAAAVAGGSLRAVEAILRGDVEHAYHPGGGLHHAMPSRASGFCVYDDPALAIARARREGLRVLYVDLDTHHGDGVQAIHWADPGVLTFSIHESGRYLFPGTGFVGELGAGAAAGTAVNLPLEALTGETAWLEAVQTVLPAVAAAFGPDLIVSQHGADAHAWDPLAHLRVTTTAMEEAARLVDRLAHRWAGGRWLATGGGGYDAYRVVPRVWTLTWLAGAHLETPASTPEAWRERWAAEADRYGQGPPPEAYRDLPNAGLPMSRSQIEGEEGSRRTAALVRSIVVPRLLRAAEDRGWWSSVPSEGVGSDGSDPADPPSSGAIGPGHPAPSVLGRIAPDSLERLALAPRVIAPNDPSAARALLVAALTDPDPSARPTVTAAVAGDVVVGIAASAPDPDRAGHYELLAFGVAPGYRRHGLGTRLLRTHVESLPDGIDWLEALVTLAERDPVEPAPGELRRDVVGRLMARAGFTETAPPSAIGTDDGTAIAGRRRVGARPI